MFPMHSENKRPDHLLLNKLLCLCPQKCRNSQGCLPSVPLVYLMECSSHPLLLACRVKGGLLAGGSATKTAEGHAIKGRWHTMWNTHRFFGGVLHQPRASSRWNRSGLEEGRCLQRRPPPWPRQLKETTKSATASDVIPAFRVIYTPCDDNTSRIVSVR